MFPGSEKAAVEVVGHVIILGITVTGISMITLVGVPVIYQLEERANVQNMEQTYTMLDSRVSRVALGEAPRQIIDVNPGGGSVSIQPNSSSAQSYVLIEFKMDTGAIIPVTIPMGKIVYRNGDREVAYEGGGVWSKYPAGSVMLSPPEFNYNGVTLTFPIVNITGNYSSGGKGTSTLNVEKRGEAQIICPNATFPNPLSKNVTQVTITLKSEYYDGWADYFRSITLATVKEVPDEKKVVLSLQTQPVVTNFFYGALASKKIEMKNNAISDSYNSSKGPYSSSKSENGSIRATAEIKMDDHAIVKGNAMTHGDITGKGTITKDAYANSFDYVDVLGMEYGPVEGLSLGSTTSLVQSKLNEYQATNNNLASTCLRDAGNRTLDGKYSNNSDWKKNSDNNPECVIYTGNYYLEKFDLGDKSVLILDTTSGAVNMAIESHDLKVSNNANINVRGSYHVRIYLNEKLDLNNNALINPTNNDKSYLFQVITSSSQDITIHNNVDYRGFIWAPYSKIELENDMEVFGAIVGKEFKLKNNQAIHYDEALQNYTEMTSDTTMMYLYITRYDVMASVN
ncbi:MAG: hypothetical protein O8C66_08040 [Candidatus Methanoperedens sp.]|nr:hypothetical protein [Candidatus Methanoperedens sp.]MCZ7370446.1 hypothetical protein [Candidatus Methanoperedens sp.]